MAVVAQNNVAGLMRKTLNRQATVSRDKLRLQKNQVHKIVQSYVVDGNTGPYNQLVQVLTDCELSDDNIEVLLQDSISCIFSLNQELKQFVDMVCEVEWASRNKKLVELYTEFALSLVTAHPYHCPRLMKSLFKLFTNPGENWGDSPEKTILWSNVHEVIARIVEIMPLASDTLMTTVIDEFPYYKAGCYSNRAYIHNLIWISKYIPSLTEEIMSIIINRMITIDVNTPVSKTRLKTESEMDIDDTSQDTLDTLDYCMIEMLKWLEHERGYALDILCTVFGRVILPTHGIRHVQFLLLYAISINQQCADRVLTNLWTIASGHNGIGFQASATRKTAVIHLSGLLARCVRVPNTRIIKYLKLMADWCHSYITATQESTSTTVSDSPKVHGAFHAICHAIFYLVAFKHHHLFSCKENIRFVESLNLSRLVTCPLNPLRTCPPQVTRAFSHVTRTHQVVYCQAIIERNIRQTIRADQHYDEWFPYDPYTLPVSGKIIWPLCIEYKDWSREGIEETQMAGMKRKFEGEDDDFLMSGSLTKNLASSLSNCISPGFKTSESV